MKVVIVCFLTGTIPGSYPVMQDTRIGKARAEKLARDWCADGQRTYLSHKIVDDGRSRSQERADYRTMKISEARRTGGCM